MKIHNRVIYILTFGIMWIGLVTLQAPPNAYGSDLNKYSTVDTSDVEYTASVPEAVSVEKGAVAFTAKALDEGGETGTIKETATPTPEPSPTPEPTPTPIPIPNDLVCEGNPEIHTLVQNYLNAKLTCDRNSFTGLVTNINMLNLNAIQHQVSMVEGFHNITIYTKRGYGVIDYVVYYTYLMDIVTIDTPVLAIDELFVTHDDNDNFVVFVGNLEDETLKEVTALSEDQDVSDLINRTYAEIGKATAADDDLLAFWQRLYSSDFEE